MNTIACMSKVLQRITENMDSFENSENLTNMAISACNIGSYTIKNLLPCTLLGNVLKILKKFKPITSNYPQIIKFLNEVDEFYHKGNLCKYYKIVILTNHSPAVEYEILNLLKLCLDIKTCQDMSLLKIALLSSNLPQVCTENHDVYLKINAIFKEAFLISKGNPLISYLSSTFVKAVNDSGVPSCIMFAEHLQHFEALLSLPLQICSKEQQAYCLEQLIFMLAEAVNLKLCETEDVLYLTALYPMHYYHLLKYCSESNNNYVFEFLKILWKSLYFVEIKEKQQHVSAIITNPIWRFLSVTHQ